MKSRRRWNSLSGSGRMKIELRVLARQQGRSLPIKPRDPFARMSRRDRAR